MGAPLTGKDATIKIGGSPAAVSTDVIGWEFRPTGNFQTFASDKTSGHKHEYASVKNFDATVTMKVPLTGKLPFKNGDLITVQFHGDDSDANYIQADCIVKEHPIPADINEGQNSEVVYSLGPRGVPIYFGVYWPGAGSSGT